MFEWSLFITEDVGHAVSPVDANSAEERAEIVQISDLGRIGWDDPNLREAKHRKTHEQTQE